MFKHLTMNKCSPKKKKGKGKRDGKNGAYKFFEQPCIDEKKKLFP